MRVKSILQVMPLICVLWFGSSLGQMVSTDTSRLAGNENLFFSYSDSNIFHPIADIEAVFQADEIELRAVQGIRFKTDKTKRGLVMAPAIGQTMLMKIKPAPKGGDAVNNAPRFEMAAYELQKLFLDSDEYVVPPTGVVGFSMNYLKKYAPKARPTFSGTDVVITALQYWLHNVTNTNIYDKKRFEADSVYAKHFANLNLMTYLLKHSDANKGNVLVSTLSENPRLFSVDNGLIFDQVVSKQGDGWSQLHVNKFPEKTVERLRRVSLKDLAQQLETVVQFKLDGEACELLPREGSFNDKKGVRRQKDVYQMGLTAGEIEQIYQRIQNFLKDYESGRYSEL